MAMWISSPRATLVDKLVIGVAISQDKVLQFGRAVDMVREQCARSKTAQIVINL
jgi:hypothetical protein